MCETNSKHIELQLGLQSAVFKSDNLLSHYQKHDMQSVFEKVTRRPTQYNDVGCIGVFCYSYGQLQFVHRSATPLCTYATVTPYKTHIFSLGRAQDQYSLLSHR